MTRNIAILACVSIATFMLTFVPAYTVVTLDKKEEAKPVVKVNVNCVDGSKWRDVEIGYQNIGVYDLFKDGKWTARVPSGACALIAID